MYPTLRPLDHTNPCNFEATLLTVSKMPSFKWTRKNRRQSFLNSIVSADNFQKSVVQKLHNINCKLLTGSMQHVCVYAYIYKNIHTGQAFQVWTSKVSCRVTKICLSCNLIYFLQYNLWTLGAFLNTLED